MTKFKIKVSQIKEFAEFLLSLELRGRESRMRTRLIKQLDQKLKDVQQEFQEHILKEYCNLDDDGNPKTKEVNGQYYWDIKDGCQEDFNREYRELWNEEYIIEGENNREMLLTVKDAVLNCDQLFSGQEALKYDEYCELVEAIEE